jgi:hypothetical protein
MGPLVSSAADMTRMYGGLTKMKGFAVGSYGVRIEIDRSILLIYGFACLNLRAV